MESQTILERLALLRQKSRKALVLYKKAFRSPNSTLGQFSEAQLREWKIINLELFEKLTQCLEQPNSRLAVNHAFSLRDGLHTIWRENESLRRKKQDELTAMAGAAEFVKAALLAQELVALKAREQASRAAYHELQVALGKSRANVEEAPQQELLAASPEPAVVGPNVIQLRRRRG